MRMVLAGLIVAAFWTPAAAQAPLSTAQEILLKAGDTFRECALCPEMVAIPPGMFLMGGAWGYPRSYLRIAVRGRQGQAYRYINAGVRVAREIAR